MSMSEFLEQKKVAICVEDILRARCKGMQFRLQACQVFHSHDFVWQSSSLLSVNMSQDTTAMYQECAHKLNKFISKCAANGERECEKEYRLLLLNVAGALLDSRVYFALLKQFGAICAQLDCHTSGHLFVMKNSYENRDRPILLLKFVDHSIVWMSLDYDPVREETDDVRYLNTRWNKTRYSFANTSRRFSRLWQSAKRKLWWS